MADNSDRKPEDITNEILDFGSPWASVIPDNDATNNFISGLGIIFNHYVAIPNVIYESNIGDLRRIFPEELPNAVVGQKFDFIENGFLYKYAGQVWGIFQGNNKRFDHIASGLYTKAGAMCTMNRYYRKSNKYASFAEYDKLIPCVSGEHFFSVNWEKTQVSLTGINRLQFLATAIEYIIDSAGRMYEEGQDFELFKGDIKWLNKPNSDRPGIDPGTGRGRIIAVRYKYKPSFYVQTLAHDIRMSAIFDSQGSPNWPLQTDDQGNISYKPGPSSVNIVADFVFLDRRSANENGPDDQIQNDATDNSPNDKYRPGYSDQEDDDSPR